MAEEKQEKGSQQKGSRLKTTLGLENLKGLGETVAQIKEAKESLDEVQKTLGEVAKDNSPLGKALARMVEAQGMRALNEDNVNVSEEVRRTMAEQLEGQEKKIDGLEAENAGLKEDKQVREITQAVEAKLDERLPSGSGNGQSKLTKAIEDVVAAKLERLLGGDAVGEGTLTSEQIRGVIREEVAALGGGKTPEDMVDGLMNALTAGDRLREKLGVAGTGIGGRLLQDQGGNSGLRTDLVRALLEDERERLKITQDHESAMQKNQHLGTLAGAVKDNLSDGIAALKSAAEEAAKASTGSESPASEQPQVFSCGTCGVKFSPPPGWEGQPLECPKPNGGCGRIYTKEELLA